MDSVRLPATIDVKTINGEEHAVAEIFVPGPQPLEMGNTIFSLYQSEFSLQPALDTDRGADERCGNDDGVGMNVMRRETRYTRGRSTFQAEDSSSLYLPGVVEYLIRYYSQG